MNPRYWKASRGQFLSYVCFIFALPCFPLMRDVVLFFLIFVIALACRSQALGWPNIWNNDINEIPWLGQSPGYPDSFEIPSYHNLPNPAANAAPLTVAGPIPMTESGGVIQLQPGHTIIIQPGVNGDPHRVEQRHGIVTQSTLSS
jgi:hypothetical protein